LPGTDPEALEYTAGFLTRNRAADLLEILNHELQWRQRDIVLFGRRVAQPRLVAWYGDPGCRYTYSGLTLDPRPWHPALLELRRELEQFLGAAFNFVLANAYRDGQDSMGWHSDDEGELGPQPLIASISLGAQRRFLIRRRGHSHSIGLDLEHGSLLVMKGDSQVDFQHCLPKTRKPVGLRINLTYRYILL
jgi:alkylated DNA repair dioxygenase AlkB